jgi:hypothetical protein
MEREGERLGIANLKAKRGELVFRSEGRNVGMLGQRVEG